MAELSIHEERWVRTLEHPADRVRHTAIAALGQSDNPRVAIPLALHVLRDSIGVAESIAAIRAIQCVEDESSRLFALALLAGHPEPAIRTVSQRLRRAA